MNNRDNDQARILIVDDERINLNLLNELLSEDYKIMAATNGEQALKAVTKVLPDLILLDIRMPDMSGYAVCKKLREDETTKNIPVIFITALSDSSDETLGFSVGAVDYITKPFAGDVVRARVKTHIRLKQQSDLLASYAFKDALTTLNNRRAYDQQLLTEWNRCRRNEHPLSLIIFDIDHFKLYNDTYGHGRGDNCLTKVGRAVNQSLQRAGDFPARYGGEEFVVILPQTRLSDAMTIAELVRNNIEALQIIHEKSSVGPVVTASFGVASVVPRDNSSTTQLQETADQALYASKEQGRNRVTGLPLSSTD